MNEELEKLRLTVLGDEDLQKQLQAFSEAEDFAVCLVEIGRVRGFEFNIQDVFNALGASRRTWVERWI